MLPRLPSTPAARYAVAVASVAAAWLAKLIIDPHLGLDNRPTLLWLVAAVLSSAWYGGLGPGLFATALSAGMAFVVFFKPVLSPGDS